MAGEDAEGQQQPNPLAAERERLRQAGYTDAEISDILVRRATGGGTSRHEAALPQGVLSSVLGSIVAIGGYAAGLFTSIPNDAATMFDTSSNASARSGAFMSLVFKGVVIGVLGYAGWQEWQQHIVSQTEIAAHNAVLTEAQAKKARAEAMVAEQVAQGERAKAASIYGNIADAEAGAYSPHRTTLTEAPATPDSVSTDYAACRQSEDNPDLAIGACTRLLTPGIVNDRRVTERAYIFRGMAHRKKHEDDLAIADYNEALKSTFLTAHLFIT